MTLPESAFGVVALVALVIPGVVFAGVRSWLRGFKSSDQTAATRILDALLVSVILDAIYLWLFGELLVPFLADPKAELAAHPGRAGFLATLLGVIVPAAIALGWHADVSWSPLRSRWWPSWIRFPRRRTAYESTPTAWDKAAPRQADVWVRVLLPSGERVAGWVSGQSFVSTYPHPRDIYIQEQFAVDERGTIGERMEHTAGVWLSIPDGAIVEWLYPNSEDESA